MGGGGGRRGLNCLVLSELGRRRRHYRRGEQLQWVWHRESLWGSLGRGDSTRSGAFWQEAIAGDDRPIHFLRA